MSLRESFVVMGDLPAGWPSTVTVAPGGWLEIPISWELPWMMVAQARTTADATLIAEAAATSSVRRFIVSPPVGTWSSRSRPDGPAPGVRICDAKRLPDRALL